jgi:poly(3-hydroxybutyrate) depolymerase
LAEARPGVTFQLVFVFTNEALICWASGGCSAARLFGCLNCLPRTRFAVTNPQLIDERTNVMRALVSVVCAAWALGLTVSTTPAQEMKDPQQSRTLKRKITKSVMAEYWIYLPKDYNARAKTRWPLILFLHGSGERGTNLSKVAANGPPRLVKQARDFPFIIVSPQCPANNAGITTCCWRCWMRSKRNTTPIEAVFTSLA